MQYLLLILLSCHIFADSNDNFTDFIADIKIQAQAQNISDKTLTILDNLTPNQRVIELDNSQAEFSLNFWQYINSRVSPRRVLIGGLEIKLNTQLFADIYHKYGVPKQILIAFWGLESNFGVNTGSFNLVRSLVTLAFDKRRRSFFTKQLLAALKLIDDDKLDKNTKSSWAGAMGSVQFMPTNVERYGIDKDLDREINLWTSKEDIFYSAANFLAHIGWNKGEKWGREIILPTNFDYSLADLRIKKNLNEWRGLGVLNINSHQLPTSTLTASIVLPMGYKGPAFLVYRNFRAILNWNRSILYALSVGILSDKLIGKELKSKFIFAKKISKNDIKFIQKTLNDNGFDVGKIDGIIGKQTRKYVRKYQKHHKLVADGYLSQELLTYMKK